MNKYVIVSGGTGSMCARTIVFLLAAMKAKKGMDGRLYIRVVDMDKKSDASAACKKLIEDYESLRKQTNVASNGGLKLPDIVMDVWDFTDAVKKKVEKSGIKLSEEAALSLKTFFLSENYDKKNAMLLNTFFDAEEQNANLDKGFYGHPNIGSVVFNLVKDSFLERDSGEAKSEFMLNFYSDLKKCKDDEKVPVYLFGSLFGGTGASVIPNMIDILQSITDPEKEQSSWGNKLRIGAAMMMPYFKLPDKKNEEGEGLSPDYTKFFSQTKAALQYYGEFKIADKLESLLLLGQEELCNTSEVFSSGEKQYQHFHILLLAAAAAALRFFDRKLGQGVLMWKVPWKEEVTPAWETLFANDMDLREEEDMLQKFFRFSVVVSEYMRCRYTVSVVNDKPLYEQLKIDETVRATCYHMAQVRPEKKIIEGAYAPLTDKQLDDFYKNPVDSAVKFCRDFIHFYFDCAVSGYDWSKYHVKNEEGLPIACKASEYLAGMNERMVDLLNIEKADKLIDGQLSSADVDKLMLNSYFDYQPLNRERQKLSFKDSTVGSLFERQVKKLVKKNKNNGEAVFAQIYVSCYDAAIELQDK